MGFSFFEVGSSLSISFKPVLLFSVFFAFAWRLWLRVCFQVIAKLLSLSTSWWHGSQLKVQRKSVFISISSCTFVVVSPLPALTWKILYLESIPLSLSMRVGPIEATIYMGWVREQSMLYLQNHLLKPFMLMG